MKRAIIDMHHAYDYVLTDAMPINDLEVPVTPIIKGDLLSITIAAASVIAKVTRDHILYDLDKLYPEYEFAHHKGYPTKRHLELLRLYGPTSDYRFTYKPVRDLIEKGDVDEKTR